MTSQLDLHYVERRPSFNEGLAGLLGVGDGSAFGRLLTEPDSDVGLAHVESQRDCIVIDIVRLVHRGVEVVVVAQQCYVLLCVYRSKVLFES